MSRCYELIDAVNEAKTQHEHDTAEAYLDGYREGAGCSCIAADWYVMGKYGTERPMCAGVLLDWKPLKEFKDD